MLIIENFVIFICFLLPAPIQILNATLIINNHLRLRSNYCLFLRRTLFYFEFMEASRVSLVGLGALPDCFLSLVKFADFFLL